MDELIAFIKARLDEDEAREREMLEMLATAGQDRGPRLAVCFDDGTSGDAFDWNPWDVITDYDPARVLREVAAKRAILGRHKPLYGMYGPCCAWCSDDVDAFGLSHSWPCEDVRDIIAVWSDHPDYRQDWGPAPEAAVR